jgi:hypothetical protein
MDVERLLYEKIKHKENKRKDTEQEILKVFAFPKTVVRCDTL